MNPKTSDTGEARERALPNPADNKLWIHAGTTNGIVAQRKQRRENVEKQN